MEWIYFLQLIIVLFFGAFISFCGYILGKDTYKSGSRDSYIQREKIDPESLKVIDNENAYKPNKKSLNKGDDEDEIFPEDKL